MGMFSVAKSVAMCARKPLSSNGSAVSKVMSLKNFSSEMCCVLVPSLVMIVTSLASLIMAKVSFENFGVFLSLAMVYLSLSTLNCRFAFFLNSVNFTGVRRVFVRKQEA